MIKRNKRKNEFNDTIKAILWAGCLAIIIRTFLVEPFHIPSDSMLPNLFVGDHLFVSKLSYGYSKQSFPFSLPLIKNRIFEHEPEIGDVIVFKKIKGHPDNYIKRLIGKPGDKIQVKGGILHINDQPIKREYVEKFYIINLPYRLRKLDSLTINTNGGQVLTIIDTKKLYLNGRLLRDNQYTIAYKEGKNFQGEAIELNKYKQTLPNGKSFFIAEISDDQEHSDNTGEYIVPEDHYFMMGDNRDMSEDSRFDDVGFIHKRDLIGKAEIIFYSHNNSVNLLEFWKYLKPIRYERFLKKIN